MTDGGETEHGLFWAGAPLTVRSELFHIYSEETDRSLCGKYRHGNMNETTPVEEGDTWKDGRDCKSCSRKADPVEVDDA
ncbi:hypothetical protein [Halorubrum trueperi]|uniref:GNAT family acetyltransferase n=1 Tax=Halorubrum trueperi TaxID=2004704 RepID=A0ABD5UF39_9EURY